MGPVALSTAKRRLFIADISFGLSRRDFSVGTSMGNRKIYATLLSFIKDSTKWRQIAIFDFVYRDWLKSGPLVAWLFCLALPGSCVAKQVHFFPVSVQYSAKRETRFRKLAQGAWAWKLHLGSQRKWSEFPIRLIILTKQLLYCLPRDVDIFPPSTIRMSISGGCREFLMTLETFMSFHCSPKRGFLCFSCKLRPPPHQQSGKEMRVQWILDITIWHDCPWPGVI